LPRGTKAILTKRAAELGKKKSQMVVEALQDYFDGFDADNEILAFESGKYDGMLTSFDEARKLVNAA
jgi:hypothetical protein